MHRKIAFLLLAFFFSFYLNISAQVTIGSNELPNKGALLDLKQENSSEANSKLGLLLPRVLLKKLTITGSDTSLATTITNAVGDWDKDEHTGLLIYNISESNSCTGAPPKGVYSWDSQQWVDLWSEKLIRPSLGNGTDDYEGANTYIVLQGNSVDIPVKRAFDIWNDYNGSDITTGKVLNNSIFPNFNTPAGNMSVSVVWEECEDRTTTSGSIVSSIGLKNASSGSGTNDYISITVGNTHTGNALIALMVDGLVIWQWQIWVPIDDPTVKAYGYDTGLASYWFMDRYLGAISTEKHQWDGALDGTGGTPTYRNAHGMFYQWGRPTPMKKFGLAVPDYIPVIGDEAGNLHKALQTPLFIRSDITSVGNTNTEDWYSNTFQTWKTRWGDGTTDDKSKKTAFDPCPKGWRVPIWKNGGSPWKCLEKPSTTNYTGDGGYDFTDLTRVLGYFPANGYRVRNTGVLYDVSNFGTVWTGTPSSLGGTGGHRLFFNSSQPFPESEHSYANGLAVRCVQDN
ncbi:MAG: hypothetical protein ACK5KT_11980 [Dysgonomonas sp.]